VKLLGVCKYESPQKDESRAQSADSLKAYRKPRVLIVVEWSSNSQLNLYNNIFYFKQVVFGH